MSSSMTFHLIFEVESAHLLLELTASANITCGHYACPAGLWVLRGFSLPSSLPPQLRPRYSERGLLVLGEQAEKKLELRENKSLSLGTGFSSILPQCR